MTQEKEYTPAELVKLHCKVYSYLCEVIRDRRMFVKLQPKIEVIDKETFGQMPRAERARLESLRPTVAGILKRRLQEFKFDAREMGIEWERVPQPVEKQTPRERSKKRVAKTVRKYYETFDDGRSVRDFLQGGAPGLIQQK